MPDETGDDAVVTEPIETDLIPILGDEDPDEAFEPHFPSDQASSDAPPTVSPGRNDESDGAVTDPVARLDLDPQHRKPFEGLLYIGALTHTFSQYGHTFEIRTLRSAEYLKVSLLVKEWDGTLGRDRAYLTAMAAACCERVDGRPLYTPLGPGDDEVAGRFRYVLDHWYPWTSDAIYQEYLALEQRVVEILEQMGEASS